MIPLKETIKSKYSDSIPKETAQHTLQVTLYQANCFKYLKLSHETQEIQETCEIQAFVVEKAIVMDSSTIFIYRLLDYIPMVIGASQAEMETS